jgi:hypothetical protein
LFPRGQVAGRRRRAGNYHEFDGVGREIRGRVTQKYRTNELSSLRTGGTFISSCAGCTGCARRTRRTHLTRWPGVSSRSDRTGCTNDPLGTGCSGRSLSAQWTFSTLASDLALRTGRTLLTRWALPTRCALSPLSTRRPLPPGRTLAAGRTLNTCGPLCALRPNWTDGTGRTGHTGHTTRIAGSTLDPSVAVRTLNTLRPLQGARGTSKTLCALITGVTGRTLLRAFAGVTLSALSAGRTGYANCTAKAGNTLRPGRTLKPADTLRALITGRSGYPRSSN